MNLKLGILNKFIKVKIKRIKLIILWGCVIFGVYQWYFKHLIMHMDCSSRPDALDYGTILEDIWFCRDVCARVVNGS